MNKIITNKLYLLYGSVVGLWLSFFGAFLFFDDSLTTRNRINFLAYAYIVFLISCVISYLKSKNNFKDDDITIKILLSSTMFISFLGTALGWLGLMGGSPVTLPSQNFYVGHYLISSMIYNLVAGYLYKSTMGVIFFSYFILNIIFVLLIVLFVIF